MHTVAALLVAFLIAGCSSSSDSPSTEAPGGSSGAAGSPGAAGSSGGSGAGGSGGQPVCPVPEGFVCSAEGGPQTGLATEAYRWDKSSSCFHKESFPDGLGCIARCGNDLDLSFHFTCLRAPDGPLLLVPIVGHDRFSDARLPSGQGDPDCADATQSLGPTGGADGLPPSLLCGAGGQGGSGGAGGAGGSGGSAGAGGVGGQGGSGGQGG